MSHWSEGEKHTLIVLRVQGISFPEIGQKLGRSGDAVRQRYNRLTATPPEPQPVPVVETPEPETISSPEDQEIAGNYQPELDKKQRVELLMMAIEKQHLERKLYTPDRRPVVELDEAGWFGIVFGGDWHVGSVHSDLDTILSEAYIIRDTKALYYAFLGDLEDGAAGNTKHTQIANERSDTSRGAKSHAYTLAEIMAPKTLIMVSGCHDVWAIETADVDYVKFLARLSGCPYLGGGGLWFLKTPGITWETITIHKAKGNSNHNDCYCCVKLVREEYNGADIVAVGHQHIIATARQRIAGKTRFFARTSSRKLMDGYGATIGEFGRRENMGVPVLIAHGSGNKEQAFWVDDIEIASWVLKGLRGD